MSAHRSLGKNYALPDNPVFVDFPSSDGNPSLWPKTTTKVVDSDGHVNFMDPVPLDHSISIKWRVQVGDAVGLSLNWDSESSYILSSPARIDVCVVEGKNYVLSSFPAGYQMFDHHKGPENKPRHDVYLIGQP